MELDSEDPVENLHRVLDRFLNRLLDQPTYSKRPRLETPPTTSRKEITNCDDTIEALEEMTVPQLQARLWELQLTSHYEDLVHKRLALHAHPDEAPSQKMPVTTNVLETGCHRLVKTILKQKEELEQLNDDIRAMEEKCSHLAHQNHAKHRQRFPNLYEPTNDNLPLQQQQQQDDEAFWDGTEQGLETSRRPLDIAEEDDTEELSDSKPPPISDCNGPENRLDDYHTDTHSDTAKLERLECILADIIVQTTSQWKDDRLVARNMQRILRGTDIVHDETQTWHGPFSHAIVGPEEW